MSALVNKPSVEPRQQAGRGTSERRSARSDELRFQKSTSYPTEFTAPSRIVIEASPTAPVELQEAEFARRLGDLKAILEGINARKAAKLAKLHPTRLAFRLGWQIGQFAIDRGWIPMPGGSGQPDQTVGPDGWSHIDFEWVPCGNQPCAPTGNWGWNNPTGYAWLGCPTGSFQCGTGSSFAGSYAVYPDPATSRQNEPGSVYGHELIEGTRRVTRGGFNFIGSGVADDDLWTQTLVPGHGTPIAPSAPAGEPNPEPLMPQQMPQAKPFSEADTPHPLEQPPRPETLPATTTPVIPIWAVPVPVVVVSPVVHPVPGAQPTDPVPAPVAPIQVITVPPGGAPSVSYDPPAETSPPSKGDRFRKEQKLSVRSVAGKAWLMINAATEAYEIVQILHDELPKECQVRGHQAFGKKAPPDPYKQLKAVWDCWDHLDSAYWERVVEGMFNNAIEDAIFGAVGQVVKKTQQNIGSPTGLQRALRENQKRVSEGDPNVEGDEGKLPLPKLDYEQGAWVLTFG